MNELEQAAPVNPFTNAPVAVRPSVGAVANTDAQRAIAEVQAAMMIARANPRDIYENEIGRASDSERAAAGE
jgi:hypothetical protein